MDNLTENGKVTADTAEADKEQKAAAVLGKFKDVQTLMKAYSDLEAEFTRRSQRLKELEKENKAETEPDGAKASPSQYLSVYSKKAHIVRFRTFVERSNGASDCKVKGQQRQAYSFGALVRTKQH